MATSQLLSELLHVRRELLECHGQLCRRQRQLLCPVVWLSRKGRWDLPVPIQLPHLAHAASWWILYISIGSRNSSTSTQSRKTLHDTSYNVQGSDHHLRCSVACSTRRCLPGWRIQTPGRLHLQGTCTRKLWKASWCAVLMYYQTNSSTQKMLVTVVLMYYQTNSSTQKMLVTAVLMYNQTNSSTQKMLVTVMRRSHQSSRTVVMLHGCVMTANCHPCHSNWCWALQCSGSSDSCHPDLHFLFVGFPCRQIPVCIAAFRCCANYKWSCMLVESWTCDVRLTARTLDGGAV
jgi:hypothetical protein